MTALDDAGFSALADPACLTLLPVLPELDPSLGIGELRDLGCRAAYGRLLA